MTIQNQIATLIAECQALPDGMDAKGVLPSTVLNDLLVGLEPCSSWQLLDANHFPAAGVLLDVAVQRRVGEDIVQAIVRGVQVVYPRNDYNAPVYYHTGTGPIYGQAVELDGWYVYAFAESLVILPPAVAHTDL